jgi:hypothetical protein
MEVRYENEYYLMETYLQKIEVQKMKKKEKLMMFNNWLQLQDDSPLWVIENI